MDNDLKEALKAIQTLRAALWIAYDGGGREGMEFGTGDIHFAQQAMVVGEQRAKLIG